MRLSALDLIRYGKFTDHRLIFGPAEPARPDLHIVYGPNEAGKSTLFSAVLDLFFGIHERSAYGFLHPYETMRVGALVETGGTSHAVARLKRRQNTLVGPDDQPLPDGFFAAPLAGIDRTTYQLMFSLDDETIEKGGESILRSEGELGALLFSASSGLSDVSTVLAGLKGQAEAFYRPQARKHRLAELKAELDRLKTERAAIDVSHSQFAGMRKTLEAARGQYEAAMAQRAELRLAHEAARTRLDALPVLQRLQALRADHARFDETPDPPAAWHDMLPQLMREETELVLGTRQTEAALGAVEEDLAGLALDRDILPLAGAIKALAQGGLAARYSTAREDLPARIAERDRVAAALAARLVQAGRADDEDAAALVLPAARLGRIRALGEAHARLSERAEAAGREQARAAAALRAIEAASADGDEGPGAPVPGLADLLRGLRRENFAERRRLCRATLSRLGDALDDHLAALGLADADTLARCPAPPAGELSVLAEETATLSARAARLDERLGEERARLAALNARLQAEADARDFADDATAMALRTARDAAWRSHRETLDRASADRFEQALAADDAAAAARLSHSGRLAERRTLDQAAAESQARLAVLQSERDSLAEVETALTARRTGLLAACGLPETMSLPAFAAWCARREAALALRQDQRAAQRDLASVDAEEAQARDRLAAFAEETAASFEAALAAAERRLEAEQAAAAARQARGEALSTAKAALAARTQDRADAQAALADWHEAWGAALAGTWLAGTAEDPQPAAVLPCIALLSEIDSLVTQKAGFDHRILAMTEDQASFRDRVRALAAEAGEDPEQEPLVSLARLQERLSRAEQTAAEQARLDARRAQLHEARDDLAARLERHEAARAAMTAHFGVASLTDLSARLEAVRARARLATQIAEREQELAERLRAGTVEAAEREASALDGDALRRTLADLDARLEQAEIALQERHTAMRDAERLLDKAAGSDEAAFLDERRRTVLAEIEEEAQRYLRLRTGVLAGEMALRLYRERHRSAMMRRASDAFATISGGGYTGLSTETAKDGEFLIAHPAAGGSKLASNLSKGTRFQLYLALRIAGFHEIAAQREPLPFIADDIMETFDDNRAFHAFRLMGDMAGVGQVIYLTHHEHLCAIARDACPGATVHRL